MARQVSDIPTFEEGSDGSTALITRWQHRVLRQLSADPANFRMARGAFPIRAT